jgi:hypothetical protein
MRHPLSTGESRFRVSPGRRSTRGGTHRQNAIGQHIVSTQATTPGYWPPSRKSRL